MRIEQLQMLCFLFWSFCFSRWPHLSEEMSQSHSVLLFQLSMFGFNEVMNELGRTTPKPTTPNRGVSANQQALKVFKLSSNRPTGDQSACAAPPPTAGGGQSRARTSQNTCVFTKLPQGSHSTPPEEEELFCWLSSFIIPNRSSWNPKTQGYQPSSNMYDGDSPGTKWVPAEEESIHAIPRESLFERACLRL